jgi:serine/threonine protein phosphatase PrpC
VRSGLPNQDAIGWRENADCAGGVLLAVADGHGSAKCFRSDYGSRFAIEAAMGLMAAPHIPDAARLPAELVCRWRRSVQNHLAEEPIASVTLKQLERKLGKDARRAVERDPVLAYGSTLLAAMVSDTSVCYVQLGDGDILTVSEAGEVERQWPREEEQIGDETASLATRDAAREVRIRVTEAAPAMVLLATDGYANSFREDGGFLAVGPDLLRMIHTEGIAPIDENLETWLREASELGSGDDITVGLLWRM